MNSRELIFMSVGLAFLLADIIMPVSIPFLSMAVYGFLLNFVSFRNVLKTIILMSTLSSLKVAMSYGVFTFLFIFYLYFVGAIMLLPISYFTFKKLKIRERLGK